MYGLIGKMRAAPGKRDALVAILLDVRTMPDCLNYIVAVDPNDPDAIWVTEVWTDKASHSASLQMPEVKAAITKAMPIIAGFESQTETIPLGGLGL
jgi:quinol monooxygenase YgiN